MTLIKALTLSIGGACAAACLIHAMTGGLFELLVFGSASVWLLIEGARIS